MRNGVLVVELKGEEVKESEGELSTLLWRSISPHINEPLSKTRESVQANGICLSMKRINTISSETRGRTGRKRKRELWEEKKTRGTGCSQREHEIQSKGVINATFHSFIRPPPTR